MNGRIFDPALGRFMTADPQIQSPGFLQSYNRYSYGFNNPLGGMDPSGLGFLSSILDKVFNAADNIMEGAFRNPIRTAVVIAAAYYTGQWIGNELIASAANTYATASTTAGVVGTTYSTTFATVGMGLDAGYL